MSQFSFHKIDLCFDRNLLCFVSLYLPRSCLVLVAYNKTNIPCHFCLITRLSEICLMSLIALFWNFPLMICNFALLFSHSKNIRISTLITILITIIIVIIITKNHNNYCSVGVMELCFFKFVIIDWLLFFAQFLPLCALWELVTCD